ncbi:hypothetical protein [Alkalihalobacillus deserti]|uniref:hypothetical protein n=1 Tax=Alkalihalobacillus deserti TaxID=2879466 RepID=UPI003555DC31
MLLKLLETVSDTMQVAMREARKLFLFSKSDKMRILYEEHFEIYKAIKSKKSRIPNKRKLAYWNIRLF